MLNIFSIDVEDWFNILDEEKAPQIKDWDECDIRFREPLEKLLELLDSTNTKATFFWLGWFAERYPELVLKCHNAGHEIASHGYGHLLVYQVDRKVFAEDIRKSKSILEHIIQAPVNGFRAGGFSIHSDMDWAFDEIKAAGYLYDSSIFPKAHASKKLEPHIINTSSGDLIEFPQSVIQIAGERISLFGGGYLRLAPLGLTKWGIKQLKKAGRPFILYTHPREIDPDQPRLKLSLKRHFKYYVNLKTTMKKLTYLAQNYEYTTMIDAAGKISRQ